MASIEQKKDKDTLKNNEELYRSAFEITGDGFSIIQPIVDNNGKLCDYKYLYVNDEYERQTGLKAAATVGKNAKQLFSKLDLLWCEMYDNFVRTGKPTWYENYSLITKRWFNLLVFSIGKGKIGILFRDITERKKIDEKLRISEERFSKAFNESPVAVAITRLTDGLFTEVNGAYLQIFGFTRDEIIGKTSAQINILIDSNQRKEIIDLLRKNGKIHNQEVRFRTKSGKIITTISSLDVIRIANEDFVISTILDISERKRAEETLREAEERFRALVESTSDIIWQVDENAVYTYISPKVKDVLGYEPEEVVGKTPFDLIDEEDEEKILNAFLEIADKKEPFYGLENWNIHKNGSRVLLETSGVPILDENGQLLGYRGIDRDITERKKAEEALANAQVILKRQLDEIKFYYDVAPVGLAVFDTNLHFVKVNKRLAEINGIPPEDHVGKSIAEIVPSVAEPLEKLLKQIISSGNSLQNLEITGETTNMPGVKRTLLESFMPMKDSKGLVIGVNVVAQEITEQKNMQAKLQEYSKNLEQLVEQRTKQLQDKERLAAIGATAGMVGHDIRNPLQAMVGDVYLIKTDVDSLPEGL